MGAYGNSSESGVVEAAVIHRGIRLVQTPILNPNVQWFSLPATANSVDSGVNCELRPALSKGP